MNTTTTTKTPATIKVSRKEYREMMYDLNEYNRCWNPLQERVKQAELEVENQQRTIARLTGQVEGYKTSVDLLLQKYNAALDEIETLKRLPCPAGYEGSVSECGGFNCNECQIRINLQLNINKECTNECTKTTGRSRSRAEGTTGRG